MNYQTDAQICSLCVWNNHENASAVIRNCSPDHDSRCRSTSSRPQTIRFQEFPWSPSDQHTVIPDTKVEPAFIRKHRSPLGPSMSSGLRSSASQTAMTWNAVRCAARRIRRFSFSVVPRGHPEPCLLEAVPSLDYRSQQSCTVDTFRPSLSAIPRKENPPSHSPITRPRSNSLFFMNKESATVALRKFRLQKNVKTGKGPSTVVRLIKLVQRFEETGSLKERVRSGRPSLRIISKRC
ncbi:uncharacterized protein TNCV_5079351 [Trichonephila clavipes]|nr:uncharacterized protein TNCV_5079351 [Trichonephila clavipes]